MKDSLSRVRAAMLVLLASATLIGVAACGGFSERPATVVDDGPPGGRGVSSAAELRVYLDDVRPESVATIRFEEPMRWRGLNPFFAIVETRYGPHLIEMSWECGDLVSNQFYADMADRRSKRGILRAKVDTLRGCRIENFYKLPEESAVETEEDDSNDH